MNTRTKYSTCLLSLGLILALIPFNGHRSLKGKPEEVMSGLTDINSFLTPDQVARLIVSNDSTLRLIDVRSPEEYKAFTLPGAVNVPYNDLLKKDPATFLGKGEMKNILFSNGDTEATYALVLARGLNYGNVYIMKGGMNGWFGIIMNSSFAGERITARENALFETRTRAKRLFTEMNSLPDSLKMQLLASKQLEAKKLDGGCE